MNCKKKYIMILILFGLLSSASVLFAGNRAFWIDGKVSRAPWMGESYYMIEVDGLTYKILPGIRITHRYLRNKGAYNEENATVHSISTNQNIMIKVRKKDVIQIILF